MLDEIYDVFVYVIVLQPQDSVPTSPGYQTDPGSNPVVAVLCIPIMYQLINRK